MKNETQQMLFVLLGVLLFTTLFLGFTEYQAIRNFAADESNYDVSYDFDFTTRYDEVDIEVTIKITEDVGLIKQKSIKVAITVDLDDGEQIEKFSFSFDLLEGTYTHTEKDIDIDDDVRNEIEANGDVDVDIDAKYTFVVLGINLYSNTITDKISVP